MAADWKCTLKVELTGFTVLPRPECSLASLNPRLHQSHTCSLTGICRVLKDRYLDPTYGGHLLPSTVSFTCVARPCPKMYPPPTLSTLEEYCVMISLLVKGA